jgi:uncharacterized protein
LLFQQHHLLLSLICSLELVGEQVQPHTLEKPGIPRYTSSMEFEWDPDKATRNATKHRVTFHEAATVFEDFLSITVPDPDHSQDEDRYITVGRSHQGRLLIVAHMDRDNRIRIINARELTRKERHAYEEGHFD